MSPSLDKYLCEKYPKIFADRHGNIRETCMAWGFSHGDGWFHLLDRLCSHIQYRIDHPPYERDKTFANKLRAAWNAIACKLNLSYRWQLPYTNSPSVIPQLVAEQLKEKFGGLRFYARGGNREIHSAISFAEDLSYSICENCGKMDATVVCCGHGWIQTLCLDCRGDKDKELHKSKLPEDLLNAFEAAKREKKLELEQEMAHTALHGNTGS